MPTMYAPNRELEKDVELATTVDKDPSNASASKRNSQDTKLSEMKTYYQKMSTVSIPVLLNEVKTTISGISEEESTLRLQTNGLNVVTDDNTPTWYFMLFKALTHPFNILLITLAIITIATGDPIGFTVLIVMVLLSVTVRFTQEMNAIISAEALKKKITQNVSVRRPPIGESDGVEEEEEKGKGYSSKSLITRKADEVDPENYGDSTDRASSVTGSHLIQEISHESIVVGDIVILHTGCVIPADLRIIESNHLSVNQRMLTGESIPVEKFVEVSSNSLNADFLRKENLCFLGTTVEFGSGIGVVIGTGQKTFFGLNSEMLTVARPPSAFDIGVKNVSYLLMGISMVMVVVVIVVSGFSSGDWPQAGLFGVAVAVGITPEMLPMVVNSVLSVGASRMAQKKCIVKRLESIQNIGSMTCLCTDKTGTLTEDCIQLYSHTDCFGDSHALPLKIGFTIAINQTSIRSPIDQAIITSGEGGSDSTNEDRRQLTDSLQEFLLKASKISEIPFDFNRKRMSVVMDVTSETEKTTKSHQTTSSDVFLFCKGAFDQTIACCTSVATSFSSIDGADLSSLTMKPLDELELGKITALFHSLSSLGLRVICVAMKSLSEEDVIRAAANQLNFDDEKNLTVIGFLTFLDKPKADAQETLEVIKGLHVNVKVLTGDNPLIAAQVCREIGLDSTKILTGDDLYHLSWDCNDVELQELFQRTVVFAHLSPNDKAFIIRTLRATGEVVGFLGDGVNDALAMHEADIGICVDSGADIAKDAADVILTEKSLTILKNAIVVGRTVYGNTIKYIKMAASSNFGNCFSLLFAAGFLPFLPIQPVQLLIQNLLYDFSQTAIPFDKMDADYLRQPKTWDMSTLFSFIVCIGPISSIFDITIFMLGLYYFGWDDDEQQSRFQTIWFIEGLLSQTLIVHMMRTEKIPFLQSVADWRLLLASFTVSIIGIVIPNIPRLNDALQMIAPPGVYYGFLVAILLAYMFLIYAAKKLYMRYFQSWL